MKNQAFNPYMPSWEYIPDGEPHVFGDRVYVYGSHDAFNGHVFCLGDYMGWSAPVDDLSDWRCEGVIYPKTADPLNRDGRMNLFAPDVAQGVDGRYYLYYVMDKVNIISVAVCDTPAGRYEFLGYVHYADGTPLGAAPGDEPQFDPAVLFEDGKVYMYTGFCPRGGRDRTGCQATVLESDMLTIAEKPVIVVPGVEYEEGTPYAGHAYFEGPSIRKRNGLYYLVYSSTLMHELCYAVSDKPTSGFTYGGCIVSNGDVGIDTYKPADKVVVGCANNHGGLVGIGEKWYIFYHRHTNADWYSRQACAEPVSFTEDGHIPQVPITSCGLNGGPLKGEGYYPAHIACYLFTPDMPLYVGDGRMPRIMQDKHDGAECEAYISFIQDKTIIGFREFDFRGLKKISVITRGYTEGGFEVAATWDGPALADIICRNDNIWTEHEAECAIPDGVSSLFLRFHGNRAELKGIRLTAD